MSHEQGSDDVKHEKTWKILTVNVHKISILIEKLYLAHEQRITLLCIKESYKYLIMTRRFYKETLYNLLGNEESSHERSKMNLRGRSAFIIWERITWTSVFLVQDESFTS